MSLPYMRTVEYLSPSSYKEYTESPILFYLKRLGPIETKPPEDPQGFPAAVGSAFDSLVKPLIAGLLGIKCPSARELLKTVTFEKERATALGNELVQGYARCGALAALLKEGPTALEIRTTSPGYVPGTVVPILGHLDAMLGKTVLDWKTSGSNRPGEYSPTPGYDRLFSTEDPGKDQGPHKRAGEPMETLSGDWASQLCMYSWILGGGIRERKTAIDQIIIGKNGELRVAQYRTYVSIKFQKLLRIKLVAAWAAIQEERVVDPEAAEAGLEFVRAM